MKLDVHGEMRNAEFGMRNGRASVDSHSRSAYAGCCIHHSLVIRSSNNTTLLPPSKITSRYRCLIGTRHHSSSMRQTSRIASTRFPFSGFFRVRTTVGRPSASSSTCTRCGMLRARSLSVPFRIRSRFIIDQCVTALGNARPWLNLDDVIQHRASQPEPDLPDGAFERPPATGPRGGACVAGEELQLGCPWSETGELDCQPLDGFGGRRLLETCLERRGDAAALGGRILEYGLDHPRSAVLELGPHAHLLHPPARAVRGLERAPDQLLPGVRQQLPGGDGGEEGEAR